MPKLEALKLSWNRVGDKGAQAMADALKTSSLLNTLELGWNAIGTVGGVAIVEAMARCTMLRTVGLQQNKMGTQAAVLMADALRLNLRFRSLTLDRNPIGLVGVNALLKVLNAMAEIFLNHLGLVMCLEDTNVTNTDTDIRRLMDERTNGFEYHLDPTSHCVGELLRCRLSIAHGCEWLELEYVDDGPPDPTDVLGQSRAVGGSDVTAGDDGQSRPATAAQAAAGGTEQSKALVTELAKMAQQLEANKGGAASRPGTSATSRPGTGAPRSRPGTGAQRSRPGTSASQGAAGRKAGRLDATDFSDAFEDGDSEGGMAAGVDLANIRNVPLPRRGVLSFVLVPGALGEPMAHNTLMKQGPAQGNGQGEEDEEGAAEVADGAGGGSAEKIQEDAERQIPDEDGIRSRLEGIEDLKLQPVFNLIEEHLQASRTTVKGMMSPVEPTNTFGARSLQATLNNRGVNVSLIACKCP